MTSLVEAPGLWLDMESFPVKHTRSPLSSSRTVGPGANAQVEAAGQAETLCPQNAAQRGSVRPGGSSRLRAPPEEPGV